MIDFLNFRWLLRIDSENAILYLLGPLIYPFWVYAIGVEFARKNKNSTLPARISMLFFLASITFLIVCPNEAMNNKLITTCTVLIITAFYSMAIKAGIEFIKYGTRDLDRIPEFREYIMAIFQIILYYFGMIMLQRIIIEHMEQEQ